MVDLKKIIVLWNWNRQPENKTKLNLQWGCQYVFQKQRYKEESLVATDYSFPAPPTTKNAVFIFPCNHAVDTS